MSSRCPMRLGNPLKNHTCEQGEASSIWPRRSRRTLLSVTSTAHLSQIPPRRFLRLYFPHRPAANRIKVCNLAGAVVRTRSIQWLTLLPDETREKFKKLVGAPAMICGSAKLIRRFGLLELGLLPLHQFNVEAERLQLAHKNVEGFRHARFDPRLALYDGLVDFRAAVNVVRFRREQFLQNVSRTVGFERPDFHFSEALSAELGLTSERLLRDERVGTDGARVNLVVHQVRQLEHVDVADCDVLRELVARHAIEESDLAALRQLGEFEQVTDVVLASAVEYGRREWNAFAEAMCEIEQGLIVEIGDRLPNRRGAECVLEPFAHGFGAGTRIVEHLS